MDRKTSKAALQEAVENYKWLRKMTSHLRYFGHVMRNNLKLNDNNLLLLRTDTIAFQAQP